MVTGIPPLMQSSRAVLRVLAAQGPVTRPRLGVLLDMSKTTMSAAVAELDALGLVSVAGSEKGPLGRTAKIYGLGPAAGYVIGIDVGAAQVRGVAYTLDGRRLAGVERPIPGHLHASVAEVGAVIRATVFNCMRTGAEAAMPLRSIAVAVPRIVSGLPEDQKRHDAPTAPLEQLRHHVDVPIILENNVNCAAIGELHFGVARGRTNFAFLQVGVRIGLGLVIESRLLRGSRGGAGEVGRIPFPWSSTQAPSREGLEHHLGSEALVERCRAGWPQTEGEPPASAKELFSRAEAGSLHAQRCIETHARDVGRLVAACIGIVDPGMIVLGGGVGQNPLLLPEVERVATDLTWPTTFAVSAVGESGTVLGAMRLAADHSIGQLIDEDRHPAVLLEIGSTGDARPSRRPDPGPTPPSATMA